MRMKWNLPRRVCYFLQRILFLHYCYDLYHLFKIGGKTLSGYWNALPIKMITTDIYHTIAPTF